MTGPVQTQTDRDAGSQLATSKPLPTSALAVTPSLGLGHFKPPSRYHAATGSVNSVVRKVRSGPLPLLVFLSVVHP
jgi:hypothetical protein